MEANIWVRPIGNATEVTRVSIITGKEHTLVLPVAHERIANWIDGKDSRLIQEAFPELSDDEREFLLTGATREEWDRFNPPM